MCKWQDSNSTGVTCELLSSCIFFINTWQKPPKVYCFRRFLHYRSFMFCGRALVPLQPLFRRRKPRRLCHTLVQDRSAVPADHILQPVAQESVPPEGHDGLVLLPADPKIIRSAPGAVGNGDPRLFLFSAVHQISNPSCSTWLAAFLFLSKAWV